VSDAPKAGTKLKDDGSGVEAIVVKPPSEAGLGIGPSAGEAVVLGKRYTCETCGAEVLITKGGDGQLSCHGAAMVIAQPKTLPSSD
jgi:hypothetical protein